MRDIGLHLRVTKSLIEVLHKAIIYDVSFFQCFFLYNKTRNRIQIQTAEVEQFLAYRGNAFKQLYVHGSYWINLADSRRLFHPVLQQEIRLAQQLSFTHMVLHPGSLRAHEKKMQGIDALARTINMIMHDEKDIIIVLENTAHGNRAIGSDIRDLRIMLEKMEYPERVRFCIDTAHAFAYGYDIVSDYGREHFITLLQTTIGIENIALIHVNDSLSPCGSKIDHHAVLDRGYIKQEALKKIVLDPRLAHIPIILELPTITDQEETAILGQVYKWHQ